MTLAENKKIALGIIEEYSPKSEMLTDDEDIAARMNLIYATDYQMLSQEKKILKTKTINVSDDADEILEQKLPTNLYQFKRLVGLDSENNRISANYELIGDKIYLKQRKGTYIIEYYAFPTQITTDTEDDFTLELEQDALNLLAWKVADDILKVDPSANYGAFQSEYQMRLQRFDTRKVLPSAEIDAPVGNDF